MDIRSELESDLAEAMKLRDEVRMTTLRLLKSALKNYQIELGHDLSMSEALSVLQKEAKKGATSPADMGKVIGMVRQKTAGAADSGMIAKLAKQKLG